jgi:hypothetical protein
VQLDPLDDADRLPPDTDVPAAARFLLSLALGMGMQALFDPAEWPLERMRGVIADAVAEIRSRPT